MLNSLEERQFIYNEQHLLSNDMLGESKNEWLVYSILIIRDSLNLGCKSSMSYVSLANVMPLSFSFFA